MISEIVVDTNVLAHCYNISEARHPDAIKLVEAIRDSSVVLCVDEGFHIVESQNRSVIGAEYRAHLSFGTPGLYLLQFLASAGRIRTYPKRPPQSTAKQINRVIRDKGDRVFVGVAWHSCEQVLVSHDYADFDDAKREHIADEIGVVIVDSRQCLDEHCAA